MNIICLKMIVTKDIFRFLAKDLTCDTFHNVRVRAINRFGQSRFSHTYTFVIKTENSTVNAARSLQTEAKDVNSAGQRTQTSCVMLSLFITVVWSGSQYS